MHNFLFSSELDLKNFIKQKKFTKIFILCGKKSYARSGAKKILPKYLKNKTIKYYFKYSPYPEISELKKIIFSLRKFSPNLIIAVGGGSVLDYSKMANVIENTENLETQIVYSRYPIKKKLTKLIAIPTTAGSGAEVTSHAVIYINKIKYSLESEIIKPDYFFLIPKLAINA